jgi:hypothetical protein
MSVGRGLGRELGADDAVRTRPVIHDDLLSQPLAQPAADEARERVVAAAGQEPDDDPYRPGGIGGLLGDRRDREKCCERERRSGGKKAQERMTS